MMKYRFLFSAYAAIMSLSLVAPSLVQASELTLRSNEITDQQTVPDSFVFNGFGCAGGNISPSLSWEGVPADTKSLAITIYDPDAPTGSGWWHWVVFNIPADTKSIESGASLTSMPDGAVESITDFGKVGFGGACPPKGDKPHRYIVTLHALNVEKLDLDQNASGAMVGYFLNAHKIATAQITGLYAH